MIHLLASGGAETKKTMVSLEQLVKEGIAEIGQDTRGRTLCGGSSPFRSDVPEGSKIFLSGILSTVGAPRCGLAVVVCSPSHWQSSLAICCVLWTARVASDAANGNRAAVGIHVSRRLGQKGGPAVCQFRIHAGLSMGVSM